MRNGFPDYHQFPDRDHGDESFWPSFTDIMMVITMVFLLVTVMAITNNWKLVTDLQTSIQAERLAAEIALDKEAKNHSLEDQMVMLRKRLADADKVVVTKQVANEALQVELNRVLVKVDDIEKALEASLKVVQEREKQLALSSQQLDALKADRDKQLATLENRAQALTDLQGIQETSQQQVLRLQAALDQNQAQLLASQQANKDIQLKLSAAQENVRQQQAALKAEQLALLKQQAELDSVRTGDNSKIAALEKISDERSSKIIDLEKALERANAALLASQQGSDAQLTNLQERLRRTEATLDISRESQRLSEQELKAMRLEMTQLQGLRLQDENKLQALKNEFDTLGSKYQKLVRPARSSTGKHVVSVWLSRQSGREVYRIRNGNQGSFNATTRKGMAKALEALKDKYGKELYVKVIIPENSGLSYSDAWRFTTEMQRAYDYYYQNDE